MYQADQEVQRKLGQKQENECLSLNIYHESRSDSFAGRIAVADVTLNRVDSNLFPNTICEVVKPASHANELERQRGSGSWHVSLLVVL